MDLADLIFEDRRGRRGGSGRDRSANRGHGRRCERDGGRDRDKSPCPGCHKHAEREKTRNGNGGARHGGSGGGGGEDDKEDTKARVFQRLQGEYAAQGRLLDPAFFDHIWAQKPWEDEDGGDDEGLGGGMGGDQAHVDVPSPYQQWPGGMDGGGGVRFGGMRRMQHAGLPGGTMRGWVHAQMPQQMPGQMFGGGAMGYGPRWEWDLTGELMMRRNYPPTRNGQPRWCYGPDGPGSWF